MISISSRDPVVREAQAALAKGRPWLARRLLDPLLADSIRSTPEVILVASGAAALLEEWHRVERLLSDIPWLDSVGGGSGHALLTRAALDRRADSLALARARFALAVASSDEARGERLILLGRTLDRLDQHDSARVAYARAAELLPEIGDWLRLRAAGVATDSASRRALFEAVHTAVARDRIPWTEAQARERFGDLGGAVSRYEALGSRTNVLRVRVLIAARDSASRLSVRRELLQLLESAASSDERRMAVELLDQFGSLTPDEELVIARGGAGSVSGARIAAAFARALRAGLLSARDRLAYGTLLSRLGRDREAAMILAQVRESSPLGAAASYQRARSLVRVGEVANARAALRRMLREYPADTSTGWAMFLLADLAGDEGRDAPARATYRDMAHRFPAVSVASAARFRASIIALAAGDTRTAAVELDSLRALFPRSEEILAARYWSGRAWAATGDSARARERWQSVIAASPMSYYSAASARRLGQPPWAPTVSSDSIVPVPDVESAVARAQLLDRLGLSSEAELEYERLDREAAGDVARTLAIGRAYAAWGLSWRAARLAGRVLERGGGDARLYRLAYPLLVADLLRGEAKAAGMDPAIIAAVIRQESGFNPRATSAAGARGLMQVLPDVGGQIARGLGVPEWSPGLLYQPEVSIVIGTRHLRSELGRYADLALALAAYNAGGSRVGRWRRKGGAMEDTELFVERISFPETRDYVRTVLRNVDLYRALYVW